MTAPLADAITTTLAYHARTKHHFDRYAAGPGALDWDAQPDAFRHWSGTQVTPLPREVLVNDVLATDIPWPQLDQLRPPQDFTPASLGSLLRLCAGTTAWKQYGGSRWSLRVHPSSGNLHPTETWLIAAGVPALEEGLHHYQVRDHSLERRAWGGVGGTNTPGVWLGYSSIAWREAWKYGERAFRYCQLDMGHVLAALAYAAALHGWQPRLLRLDSDTVAQRLGVDRSADFVGVEAEEAEVIVSLSANDSSPSIWQNWAGKPSLLDPKPMYEWPVIEEVTLATRGAILANPPPNTGKRITARRFHFHARRQPGHPATSQRASFRRRQCDAEQRLPSCARRVAAGGLSGLAAVAACAARTSRRAGASGGRISSRAVCAAAF